MQNQTPIATGKLGEFLLLFFPLLFVAFSSCVFPFMERLLLAQFSLKAMEASVNAVYICQIFQGACVSLVMMAQVYVGRHYGAQSLEEIGPGVWQFIWFSFLSMLLVMPLSFLYGHYYFRNTEIGGIVMPYFLFLMGISFLYPLGAALSCFYLGRGKTKFILIATIGFQILKIGLTYLFIFGWGQWVPAFGLLGGAMSSLIAQGGFCILLLAVFLNRKHDELYRTRQWRFKFLLFWQCIQPGLLRACNRILTFSSWACTAHLVLAKGGDYLLVLSVGGTLFVFLSFLGEAVCQAGTTTVSQILGSQNYSYMGRAFRSGSLLVLYISSLLIIPMLIFPVPTFNSLFPNVTLEPSMIQQIFLGLWVSCVFNTFSSLPISYVLAFQDTKFSLFMGVLSWLNGYFLMYVAIKQFQIRAEQFWLVIALVQAIGAFMYGLRARKLHNSIRRASNPTQPTKHLESA